MTIISAVIKNPRVTGRTGQREQMQNATGLTLVTQQKEPGSEKGEGGGMQEQADNQKCWQKTDPNGHLNSVK